MHLSRRLLLGLALLLPAVAQAQESLPEVQKAQPELAKEPLVIITHDGKRHSFEVEVAETEQQQMVGLMFRTHVPENGGMLFDWGSPRESQMWMRNTKVPLDMVFIDANGIIRRIVENTVPESLAIISSGGPVRATLELAGGVTAKLDIRVGDRVEARQFPPAQ
jgi:uncharacterized membrane protein (UPF0127 family)